MIDHEHNTADTPPAGDEHLADDKRLPELTQSNRILMFFSSPVFEDDEKTRVARLLNTVLLVMVSITLVGYLALTIPQNPQIWQVLISSLLVVELVAYILLHLGWVRLSAIILTFALWLILVVVSIFTGGVRNPIYFSLITIVITAGFILGSSAGALIAILSILVGLWMLAAELNGTLPHPAATFGPSGYWFTPSMIFLIAVGLIYITTRSMQELLKRTRHNESALLESHRQLLATRDSLERQIADRTQELERRSHYLQAAMEISHATASILDTDQLLQETVDLILERFELYYVGLFLVDSSGEWAMLRAGTGVAGKAMLARGHRIQVGTGMIGWSIANARHRLALEPGEDAVRLATRELPETRSEASIPLRSRGKVIGAISVQSKHPGAFGTEELDAFQAIADQVAVALDNARMFAESRTALASAQLAHRQASQRAWTQLIHDMRERGIGISYRYDHTSITPGQSHWRPEMHMAAQSGQSMQATVEGENPTLFVPIKVRDQVIGVLSFSKDPPSGLVGAELHTAEKSSAVWTQEEISLLETIAEQLGVAVDSARLYEETQRRAERERLASEISAKMRATNDPQTILQTAVSELRRALHAKKAQVLLHTAQAGEDHSTEITDVVEES